MAPAGGGARGSKQGRGRGRGQGVRGGGGRGRKRGGDEQEREAGGGDIQQQGGGGGDRVVLHRPLQLPGLLPLEEEDDDDEDFNDVVEVGPEDDAAVEVEEQPGDQGGADDADQVVQDRGAGEVEEDDEGVADVGPHLPSLEEVHTTAIPTHKWPPKAARGEFTREMTALWDRLATSMEDVQLWVKLLMFPLVIIPA